MVSELGLGPRLWAPDEVRNGLEIYPVWLMIVNSLYREMNERLNSVGQSVKGKI